MNDLRKTKNSNPDLIIFYADDDHDDLDTFKDVISELNDNRQLYTHDRGDKLLNALENPPPTPHILFLDLNMPGKTGFEILEEIRRSKDMKMLPIIIVSTSNDEATIAKTRRLGANYYIPKPNNYFTLKKSIAHALTIDWNTFNPDSKEFVFCN